MPVTHRTALRFIPVIAAVALLATACATPAGGTASPAPTESAATRSPEPTPSATPSPIETQATNEEIGLPSSCDDIFTGELRATLEAELPPLNDPGVTMYSTENAEALTVLESGVPSLRCTWGTPSDRGVATTVSIVSPADAKLITDSLTSSGFAAEEASGGEYFRTSQQTLSMDEQVVELGETHFFRGNAWIATRWVNYSPDSYTPGIVAQLWP
ncbi:MULTISPECIES: hypothetical protein [Microbacterium]|uniref:DUF3558 domain-containing protein n=1 Tax=Microbacterium plantarum TaxID=1816425 RepID=A0ABV5EUQ3_9MICO|nr:hypothetical protein [Microbacterium arborescens]